MLLDLRGCARVGAAVGPGRQPSNPLVQQPFRSRLNIVRTASAAPTSIRLPGSGTADSGANTTVVCEEKLFTVVLPSRFTSIVNAKPSVVSLVRTGMVPAASENMLKANVLPEVETPSGESMAGP